MAKSFRKVPYIVKRDIANHCYYVIVPNHPTFTIKKKPQGWYACTMYHKTLRDAIIYCAYGV